MVKHLARDEALPIVLTPHGDQTSIGGLLAAEFDAVRYYPGENLTAEMARSGRLAVVVDGIDALASDARREVMTDLARYARQFPRSRFVCCVRRVIAGELIDFSRYTIEALSEQQTSDLFAATGIDRLDRFPPQVADLASWPLWALAMIEIGNSAPTGLVLLDRLLEHRLSVSGAYLPIETEMLLEAAGLLAFEAWPEPIVDPAVALDSIAAWRAGPRAVSRYSPLPADEIMERLGAAGIVQHSRSLAFAHPLFATFLAARHAAAFGGLTAAMADDPEFSMFAAAMMPEDPDGEQVDLLVHHGPIGQARFLRLVEESDRAFESSDPTRFGELVDRLSEGAAACIATDDWTAWRSADHPERCAPDAIAEWLTHGEVSLLQGNAFERWTPLALAAMESLNRFKKQARDLEPRDINWLAELTARELEQLRRRPSSELDEMLLEAAMDWRTRWHALTAAMGVSTLEELRLPGDEPEIDLVEDWPDPGVRLQWGSRAEVRRVSADTDRRWGYESVSRFLGPGREARLYREVVRRTELVLGCTFGSQAWMRPERMAAWAW